MSALGLSLSDVEVESLRQVRTRLAKTPASDAAAAVLGRTALQVLSRVGVEALPAASPLPTRNLRVAAEQAEDLAALSLVAAAVTTALGAAARSVVTGGALQALIGRRLQLAGRERVEPRA